MTPIFSVQSQWDTLVTAIESELLRTSDSEVLAMAGSGSLARVESALGVPAMHVKQKPPSRAKPSKGAAWLDRIQLIQQLLKSRPDLRPRLVAVFGDKKDASFTSSEVDAIAQELEQAENELKRSK